MEDARAALRHVDVEARRHDRAVGRPPVHRYRDRAIRRPQERHLVAQPPDVDRLETKTELAYIDTLANLKIRLDGLKRMTQIQNTS